MITKTNNIYKIIPNNKDSGQEYLKAFNEIIFDFRRMDAFAEPKIIVVSIKVFRITLDTLVRESMYHFFEGDYHKGFVLQGVRVVSSPELEDSELLII